MKSTFVFPGSSRRRSGSEIYLCFSWVFPKHLRPGLKTFCFSSARRSWLWRGSGRNVSCKPRSWNLDHPPMATLFPILDHPLIFLFFPADCEQRRIGCQDRWIDYHLSVHAQKSTDVICHFTDTLRGPQTKKVGGLQPTKATHASARKLPHLPPRAPLR